MPQMLHVSDAASMGIHACSLLAALPPEKALTSQEMAETLHGSANHMSKILQRLSRAGLVDSTRGPNGGFRLSCDAETTSVLQVFEAIEGPIREEHCMLRIPLCSPARQCIMGRLVQDVQEMVRDRFSKTTLGDMARFIND